MINKILTKTVKKGGEARVVTREFTVEWFDHIHIHLTVDHIDTLVVIETN